MSQAEKPAEPEKSTGWLSRFTQGISATRENLGQGIGNLLLGEKELDEGLVEELETILLTADVGVETTQELIDAVTDGIARKQLENPEAVFALVKKHLMDLLTPCSGPMEFKIDHKPLVILVVGVNGVGKTTTIGKLAAQIKQAGHKVMLAAGDTFRAAAVEQLQQWGERSDVPVIAQTTGSDAASVAHDAYQAAEARGIDVLIIDTAGRQHTHSDLMEELKKIKRVLRKFTDHTPDEVFMVLDAGTGQNALSQLTHFNEAVGITGLCLTKLDGTAKGGILIALAKKFALPIRYVGVGESVEDLHAFVAEDFIHALFDSGGQGT